MIKSNEVLAFLRPNGGYVQVGETYEGITFEPQCEPFTKDEYEAAFDLLKKTKEQIELETEIKREQALSKLIALGLTIDDLKVLSI